MLALALSVLLAATPSRPAAWSSRPPSYVLQEFERVGRRSPQADPALTEAARQLAHDGAPQEPLGRRGAARPHRGHQRRGRRRSQPPLLRHPRLGHEHALGTLLAARISTTSPPPTWAWAWRWTASAPPSSCCSPSARPPSSASPASSRSPAHGQSLCGQLEHSAALGRGLRHPPRWPRGAPPAHPRVRPLLLHPAALPHRGPLHRGDHRPRRAAGPRWPPSSSWTWAPPTARRARARDRAHHRGGGPPGGARAHQRPAPRPWRAAARPRRHPQRRGPGLQRAHGPRGLLRPRGPGRLGPAQPPGLRRLPVPHRRGEPRPGLRSALRPLRHRAQPRPPQQPARHPVHPCRHRRGLPEGGRARPGHPHRGLLLHRDPAAASIPTDPREEAYQALATHRASRGLPPAASATPCWSGSPWTMPGARSSWTSPRCSCPAPRYTTASSAPWTRPRAPRWTSTWRRAPPCSRIPRAWETARTRWSAWARCRGDSRTYGQGQYWMVIIYATTR